MYGDICTTSVSDTNPPVRIQLAAGAHSNVRQGCVQRRRQRRRSGGASTASCTRSGRYYIWRSESCRFIRAAIQTPVSLDGVLIGACRCGGVLKLRFPFDWQTGLPGAQLLAQDLSRARESALVRLSYAHTADQRWDQYPSARSRTSDAHGVRTMASKLS